MGTLVASLEIALGLDTSGASASAKTFGDIITRTNLTAAQAYGQVERAAEAMASRLERQAVTVGRSATEVQNLKAQTLQLATETQNMGELQGRLTAATDAYNASLRRAEEAAAAEAARMRDAAIAHQQFEAAARRGALAIKEEEAEAGRHAQTVQRLKEMLDPAAAAQNRLNVELGEARIAMRAAGASAEELARAEALIVARHTAVVQSTGAQRAGFQQLSMNLGDVATSYAGGMRAGQIFAQQSGQVVQAIALIGGESKGLIGVLAGPWGIAFTAAAVLAMALANSMGEGATKAEKEAEALKTVKGATEALDEATGRLHKTHQQEIDDTNRATTALLGKALALRTVLQAQSARITDSLTDPVAQLNEGSLGAVVAGTLVARKIAENNAKIKQLQDSLGSVGFAAAVDRATAATSKAAKATQEYEARIVRIQAAWDRSQKTARDEALVQQYVTEAIKKRDAATKAATGSAGGFSDAQGRMVGAVNDVQRAEAQLGIVRANTAAQLKAHTITEAERTAQIGQAVRAVNDARTAEHAHTVAVRDGVKAAKEAVDAAKVRADLANDQVFQRAAAANKVREDYSKPLNLNFGDTLPGYLKAIESFVEHHGYFAQMNEQLADQKKLWDDLAEQVDTTADHMERAFGRVGGSIGEAAKLLVNFGEKQALLRAERDAAGSDEDKLARVSQKSHDLQLNTLIGLTSATRGLFSEHSKGAKAMAAAEKVLTALQIVRTLTSIQLGAANMFAVGGPAGFGLVPAMLAVMAGVGVAVSGGGSGKPPSTNTGTGTVLGDDSAKSESIQRSLDLLNDLDTQNLHYTAQMAASLKSIEGRIGNLASLVVRNGNVNADAGVQTGFKSNIVGNVAGNTIGGALLGGGLAAAGTAAFGSLGALAFAGAAAGPIGIALGALAGAVLAPLVKSLFGTKTTITGNGISGAPQTLGSIVDNGFDANYYSEVQKKKKTFGITTSTKYSNVFTDADSEIEQQFSKILTGFYQTIAAAATPLGIATGDIEGRLNSFVVDIGMIDLKGLSGDEISAKLTAVFGAAADDMARTAFPGLEKFQAVGEGYFETLSRVAASVETVTSSLRTLGLSADNLGIEASMSIVGMFDSASDYASAAGAYFSAFYSQAEQDAAKTAQLADALGVLGLALPDSIASYRKLVEAQDLTTAAGQEAYAGLLKLGPAFAELNKATEGAVDGTADAAAVLRERQGLERQLLQLTGDTAAIRADELAQLQPANRAIQERIYALKDEQAAEQAAVAAAKAIADERLGLERQLMELTGQTAALRALDLAKIDASNQAIQLRIWALQDEAVATQAAAQAIEEAAQRARAIADERLGLERQLMELTGQTAALRALDLAKIDASNQAIQLRIWALQDEAVATQAAAQAIEEAAQRARAIADEQAGLARQLLEAQGDTGAIRKLTLDGLLSDDARLTQQQIWAIQDRMAAEAEAQRASEEAERTRQQAAEEAQRAAQQLADAWRSIADTILDEVKRIRGLTSTGALSFAQLQAQFNAATSAARMGDQDAAKSLAGISRDMLDTAAEVATSRQELLRVQGVTAASLEETYRLISAAVGGVSEMEGFGSGSNDNDASTTAPAWWQAAASAGTASASAADALVGEVRALRQEVERLHTDANEGNAQIAQQVRRGSDVLVRADGLGEGDGLAVKVAA